MYPGFLPAELSVETLRQVHSAAVSGVVGSAPHTKRRLGVGSHCALS